MFFLRSSSSLLTKYLPFKIRWNINILWHKRDGHLTQSVCSGNKLWREINKALMKKEWRHQFWPQTVISRWNQWISRVLVQNRGPTSLFLFFYVLFSFLSWEGTGGNRIDGWTVHILNEEPSHLLTGYDSSITFVVMMWPTKKAVYELSHNFFELDPWWNWLHSWPYHLSASFFLQFFFLFCSDNFALLEPLYAAQHQQKSHFSI